MFLAVNYHYVGDFQFPHPGIWSIGIDTFLSHLNFLRKHFSLIGIGDVKKYLDRNDLPKKTCIITFDDGLRCHYDIIAPLMAKYDFPAAFFISTKPIVKKEANNIHKSHFVRANCKPELILEVVYSYLKSYGINVDIDDRALIRKHYRYDDFEIARIKYLINYILPKEISRTIIDYLFNDIVKDEKSFCEEWYMTPTEVATLQQRFQCIGSHAYSHQPLAGLSDRQSYLEISKSKELLESITGEKIVAISYPLGNPNAVSLREEKYAKMAGYSFGFTMERAVNFSLNMPLLFSRIDCNDLPEIGKKPIFNISGDVLKRIDNSDAGRKLYKFGK